MAAEIVYDRVMQLYAYCRKAHRFFAVMTVLVFAVMTITGLLLRYHWLAGFVPMERFTLIRTIHGTVSPLAAVSIVLMGATGLVMYLYPLIQRFRERQN